MNRTYISKRCTYCSRNHTVKPVKNNCPKKLEKLFQLSLQFLDTTEEVIVGGDRHRPIVENRHLIMSCLLLRGFPSVLIGKRLNKNHASVLHAKGSIEDMVFIDPRYRIKFNSLREYLSTNNYPI